MPLIPPIESGRGAGRVIARSWLAATGFVYVEGVDPANAASILAYERFSSGGGRYVLVVGGSVEFLAEREFQKALAAPVKASPF